MRTLPQDPAEEEAVKPEVMIQSNDGMTRTLAQYEAGEPNIAMMILTDWIDQQAQEGFQLSSHCMTLRTDGSWTAHLERGDEVKVPHKNPILLTAVFRKRGYL